MKALKVLTLCASACLFAACSSEDAAEQPASAVFQVESTIVQSRTPQLDVNGAGKFTSGDQNTLFFQKEGGQYLKPFTYTYGTSYFWSDVELAADVQNCQISACYPTVTTASPANFKWDVTAQSQNPDLLAAAPARATVNNAATVKLQFNHLMHQLGVVLKAESSNVSSEMLAGAEISVRQFKPVAEVNLLKGQATAASGQSTSLQQTGNKASFIIPAQPVGQIEVVVKLNGVEKVCRLADCQVNGQALQALESGKKFTLTLGVTKEEIFVLGQDIIGWGNQGSANGSVIF